MLPLTRLASPPPAAALCLPLRRSIWQHPAALEWAPPSCPTHRQGLLVLQNLPEATVQLLPAIAPACTAPFCPPSHRTTARLLSFYLSVFLPLQRACGLALLPGHAPCFRHCLRPFQSHRWDRRVSVWQVGTLKHRIGHRFAQDEGQDENPGSWALGPALSAPVPYRFSESQSRHPWASRCTNPAPLADLSVLCDPPGGLSPVSATRYWVLSLNTSHLPQGLCTRWSLCLGAFSASSSRGHILLAIRLPAYVSPQ